MPRSISCQNSEHSKINYELSTIFRPQKMTASKESRQNNFHSLLHSDEVFWKLQENNLRNQNFSFNFSCFSHFSSSSTLINSVEEEDFASCLASWYSDANSSFEKKRVEIYCTKTREIGETCELIRKKNPWSHRNGPKNHSFKLLFCTSTFSTHSLSTKRICRLLVANKVSKFPMLSAFDFSTLFCQKL